MCVFIRHVQKEKRKTRLLPHTIFKICAYKTVVVGSQCPHPVLYSCSVLFFSFYKVSLRSFCRSYTTHMLQNLPRHKIKVLSVHYYL